MNPSTGYTFDEFHRNLRFLAYPPWWHRLLYGWIFRRIMRIIDVESDEALKTSSRRMLVVIDSMTAAERQNLASIDRERARRIARGSGVRTAEVRMLVSLYQVMREPREKWLRPPDPDS